MRGFAQFPKHLDSEPVVVGSLCMRVARGGGIPRLHGIRSGARDVAALQEVSCELSGHRRLSCSQHFEHLADPQVQPAPTVRWELFVQRLLDQRMDERKPPTVRAATLLDQSCFESGVYSREDLRFRAIARSEQKV
jgi:hypothetical protein